MSSPKTNVVPVREHCRLYSSIERAAKGRFRVRVERQILDGLLIESLVELKGKMDLSELTGYLNKKHDANVKPSEVKRSLAFIARDMPGVVRRFDNPDAKNSYRWQATATAEKAYAKVEYVRANDKK